MDAAFAALRRSLARDRTLPQAYLEFARFTAKLRCGHTYPNFFNQSREVQQQVLEQAARLPFYFRWLDRVMVVTRDLTGRGILPLGIEVRRINGVATGEILARLMTLARADGANDAKRTDQLAVTGESVYEPFDVYFPLLFGLAPGPVKLDVRDANERNSRVVLAHTLAAREAPALVIDLRGNEGGEDIGVDILARLIRSDLSLDGTEPLVRYRAVPAELAPYLTTWDPSFKDWKDAATELDRPWPTAPNVHYLQLKGGDGPAQSPGVIHPAAPHFGGQVMVLVDAANSSATFQFANLIQRHGLGTLVGQPTGGNRRGINGGAFFFLRLPRSGIEMDLPLIGYFPPDQEPDAGLIPDVLVPHRVEDLVSNTDVDMAAVRKLLAERSRRGAVDPSRRVSD